VMQAGAYCVRPPFAKHDLTGLFWTKQCENMSLERSFGYAEEAV